jgi:hypothetical protein
VLSSRRQVFWKLSLGGRWEECQGVNVFGLNNHAATHYVDLQYALEVSGAPRHCGFGAIHTLVHKTTTATS